MLSPRSSSGSGNTLRTGRTVLWCLRMLGEQKGVALLHYTIVNVLTPHLFSSSSPLPSPFPQGNLHCWQAQCGLCSDSQGAQEGQRSREHGPSWWRIRPYLYPGGRHCRHLRHTHPCSQQVRHCTIHTCTGTGCTSCSCVRRLMILCIRTLMMVLVITDYTHYY